MLITEGICELYKAILENGPNNEDIEIIVNNFITMVNSTENFMKENKTLWGSLPDNVESLLSLLNAKRARIPSSASKYKFR